MGTSGLKMDPHPQTQEEEGKAAQEFVFLPVAFHFFVSFILIIILPSAKNAKTSSK